MISPGEIAQLRALVTLKIFDPPPIVTGEVVVGVPFSFSTPSPLILGAISAGQILNRAAILIEAGFNGASPKVSFGTTSSVFLGSLDFSPKIPGQYETDELEIATANDILILTITPDGSSTGAGVVFFKLSSP